MPAIVITGAAKRVGKALAEFFADRDWEVGLHYNRSEKEAEDLARRLQQRFPHRHFPLLPCDLSDPEAVARFWDQWPGELPFPEVLVSSASVFEPASLAETDQDLWRRQFQVNFEAPFVLMQELHKRGSGGSMLNILDTRITNAQSSHAAYSLSKKALAELTRMAALEWAPAWRVNGVAPGPVLPPPGKDAAYLQKVAEAAPLQRPVALEELMEAVWFLVTNRAVTGQIVFCDSGAHLIG